MKVSCPFCHQHYEIDNPTGDKRYRCYYCGEQFSGTDAPPVSADGEAAEDSRESTPLATLPPEPPEENASPVIQCVALPPEPERTVNWFTALLGGVVVLLLALVIFQSIRLIQQGGKLESLQLSIEDLGNSTRATLAGVDEVLADNAAGLERLAARIEAMPLLDKAEFDQWKLQLEETRKTADALRAWQSKYSVNLEKVAKLLDDQTFENSFATIATQFGALRKELEQQRQQNYKDLNTLSNSINQNLILLNGDVVALQQYGQQLSQTQNSTLNELRNIQDDIRTLFRRVNWLNRYDGSTIIFVSRPVPTPVPPPPQLKTLTLTTGE